MRRSLFPNSPKKIYNQDIYIANAEHLGKGLGRGIFARRNLKKGEVLFIIKGKIVPLKINDQTDSALLPNAIGIEEGVWIDPYPENALHFLNHSCEPNVGIKGKVTVVALKNIAKDEQVTIDYSITEGDRFWTLGGRCQCGGKKCRGKIRSIQYLPKEIYQRYLPFVPAFLQKQYSLAYKP